MLSKFSKLLRQPFTSRLPTVPLLDGLNLQKRNFGAMGEIDKELLFEVNFTESGEFQSQFEKLKAFRVMDEEGEIVNPGGFEDLIPDEKLKKIFHTMVTINEADQVFNMAQRQSRISFYMTQFGEEASNIGTAAAINNHDLIFPQYRESGAFLYRGFSIEQMAHQLCGNHKDWGGGKQMPVHYGSKDLNICTVSSPLCTQLPQAAGAGYKYRINKEDKIAITYFGEGAASEGDFHPALNFAATLRAQTLFYCRNNMYAISTPIDDQYAGDGIAVRGIAYGIPTIRVDGNDIFAIYAATQKAREMIIRDKRPALIEAMSYRVGDHSTSDFSQTYRHPEEMKKWDDLLQKVGDPILRLEKYMIKKGLLNEGDSDKYRSQARETARNALRAATVEPKPSIDSMFEGVYEKIPDHLQEQRQELKAHLRKYPEQYNLSYFKDGEKWPYDE